MLEWVDDRKFTIGNTAFLLEPRGGPASSEERFALLKPRWMIDRYVALAPEFMGARVVELGTHQGGSAVFLAHLFQPTSLVTIDIATEPVQALARFTRNERIGAVIHTFCGVDQRDRQRLEQILDQQFGGDMIDVVVDDASHRLEPTLISFNVLFPRLRPGGVFIIEDWSRVQRFERALEADPVARERAAAAARRNPRSTAAPITRGLTRMILELVLTSAYAPGAVADVSVSHNFAVVRRGHEALDPESFDISNAYGTMSRALLA